MGGATSSSRAGRGSALDLCPDCGGVRDQARVASEGKWFDSKSYLPQAKPKHPRLFSDLCSCPFNPNTWPITNWQVRYRQAQNPPPWSASRPAEKGLHCGPTGESIYFRISPHSSTHSTVIHNARSASGAAGVSCTHLHLASRFTSQFLSLPNGEHQVHEKIR